MRIASVLFALALLVVALPVHADERRGDAAMQEALEAQAAPPDQPPVLPDAASERASGELPFDLGKKGSHERGARAEASERAAEAAESAQADEANRAAEGSAAAAAKSANADSHSAAGQSQTAHARGSGGHGHGPPPHPGP